MRRIATVALIVILAAVPASAGPQRADAAALDAMLGSIEIMPAREHRAVTVFPLVLREDPPPTPLGVVPLASASARGLVTFREPKVPARRLNVEVRSLSPDFVLVPAGTILTGGRLDRMVPTDVLLEPGRVVQIPTLAAEFPRDERTEAASQLTVSESFALQVLRQGAVFTPATDTVTSFVARFLEFRQPGDDRHSLVSVADSPELARRIDGDVTVLRNLTRIYEGRVVGWITVIGGRVHGMDLFGSNDLAQAYFPSMLRAHAYTIAAIDLRAEELEIAQPDPKALADPERFRPDVEAFFDAVRDAARTPHGADGFRLRKRRIRGLATTRPERFVHLSAVADLPFLTRVHDRPLPPPPDRAPRPSFAPLDREEVTEGRRLTEYEARLLERMRERRQNR